MTFLRRQPKHPADPPPKTLHEFRRKKTKRWILVVFLAALALVLFYASRAFVAFQSASVANVNSNSSRLLKDAITQSSAPINVLIIGVEGPNYPGGLLSDTMMVASIDTKAKTVSLVSLPRDLYVAIPGFGKDKLNAAHSLAEQAAAKTKQKGKGPALLREVISETFGVPIHYFVRMDFEGFAKIIDALGGVDVTVKSAIHDPFYPNGRGGYTTFSIKAGSHHFNGDTALKYARSRQTTSDFDRARRQQEIVAAVKDKITSAAVLANPKKVTDIIAIAGDHFLTDVKLSETDDLIALAKEMSNPKTRSLVLDTSPELGLLRSSTSPIGAYIIVPVSGDYAETAISIRAFLAAPRIMAESPLVDIVTQTKHASLAKEFSRQLTWAGFSPTVRLVEAATAKSSLTVPADGFADSSRYLSETYGLSVKKAQGEFASQLTVTIGDDWTKLTSKS